MRRMRSARSLLPASRLSSPSPPFSISAQCSAFCRLRVFRSRSSPTAGVLCSRPSLRSASFSTSPRIGKGRRGDVDDERLYTICMKVVFTGGGTGGDFYPPIPMAGAPRDLAREQRLIEPRLYYFAPTPSAEDR